MGLLSFGEPFTRLMNQGQVLNRGKAMSKSLGNGVDLGEQIASDVTAAGSAAGALAEDGDRELRRVTHRVIDEVTRQVEGYHLNVAVARLMELVSATRKAIDSGPGAADPAVREAAEALGVMLSLFAPYTAEECWEALGGPGRTEGPAGIPSVARTAWPAADPALLVQETVTCGVQVNGKVRDRLEVSPEITEDELRDLALATQGVARSLAGLEVQRVIVRPPRLVNIVAR
jgi:leucyl-tRNA synthetase